MKRALTVLAATLLVSLAAAAPSSAISDVAASHLGQDVARHDCGRSIFWFCGKFPTRPTTVNLCTQPSRNVVFGWCVTTHYKEISFLSAIRECRTMTRWKSFSRTPVLLLHIKVCGHRQF